MMVRPPRSLGGIIALAGLAFALMVAALGSLIVWVVHEEIERQLDHRIEHESEALRASGAERGIDFVLEVVRARETTHTSDDLGYIVVDAQGRRVGGRLDAAIPPEGYSEFMPYRTASGDDALAHAMNLPIPGGGRLIVAAQRQEVKRMDYLISGLFGAASILIILVGGMIALLLHRTVNRRLSAISCTAEAIVAGDFSRRMPLHGDREFDEVSAVINRILDRIEALLVNLRQVSSDLAHDIRSPLNRVRGSLEALDRFGAQETGEAIAEIDALLDLLNGILAISEIEGAAVRKRFVPVDLAELATDVADAYRSVAEGKGIAIFLVVEPATVLGDPSLLRRCLANIIDNAILHGGGATRIDIGVSQREGIVSLTVADDGVGIPAGESEAVFRRFARLDRSRATPGHGLGLSLVAAVAAAHEGTAALVPDRQGTVVRFAIPSKLTN